MSDTKYIDTRSIMDRIIGRNGRYIAAQEVADMKRRTACEALRGILSDIERLGAPTPSAVEVGRKFLDEADEASKLAIQIGREPLEDAA